MEARGRGKGEGNGWMYGWEERGGHSRALHDNVRLENTWLDGWDEKGGHLLVYVTILGLRILDLMDV